MSANIWKTRINKEYKKIQQARNSQIKHAWCENWKKCSTDQAGTETKVYWPPNIKSKTPNHVLSEVTPLPPMSNWVLAPRNCSVQNENKMLNIPFIGDQEGAENPILKDLLESYEEKKLKAEKDKEFDEALFLELIEALKLNYMPSNQRNLPLEPIIFKQISLCCFKEFTAEELEEKYNKMTNQSKTDDEQPSNSCEHALRTFKKYFCRRCFIYNCELHRDQQDMANIAATQIKTNSVLKIQTPDEACKIDCYRNYQTNFSSLKNKPKANEYEWSDDEKTLFRVLHNVYPSRYCIIAQFMLTKTCKQVYDYAQSEFENIPELPSVSSHNPLPSLNPQRKRGWTLYKRQQNANSESKNKMLTNSYTPCYHPGKFCDNDCSCISNRNVCEKFCNCNLQCTNRFRGCLCGQKSCNSKKCPCFAAQRECDADLCSKCGAAEYDLSKVECKNVSIQRGLRKHLLLAPSDIAGWGVFLKDAARKDEFIAEYVGEIISQEEADRRGKIYDIKKCSFLFELNQQSVLDATFWGGKIRFANHSNNPNCYAKVMMVYGDHRIGIFAKRDILPGEEILFDYSYATEQLQFVSIERKLEST